MTNLLSPTENRTDFQNFVALTDRQLLDIDKDSVIWLRVDKALCDVADYYAKESGAGSESPDHRWLKELRKQIKVHKGAFLCPVILIGYDSDYDSAEITSVALHNTFEHLKASGVLKMFEDCESVAGMLTTPQLMATGVDYDDGRFMIER